MRKFLIVVTCIFGLGFLSSAQATAIPDNFHHQANKVILPAINWGEIPKKEELVNALIGLEAALLAFKEQHFKVGGDWNKGHHWKDKGDKGHDPCEWGNGGNCNGGGNNTVPEPATLALFGLGLFFLSFTLGRKKSVRVPV